MSEAYFGMRQLMEPEGWPPAKILKRLQAGCTQPIKDKDREERKCMYRKLAEQGKPLFERSFAELYGGDGTKLREQRYLTKEEQNRNEQVDQT
jgi:hypothetical protein